MFKRISLALFCTVILLGSFAQTVVADGMILPDLATTDYMEVRYHDVTVDIHDGFAVTKVDQEFYNPHNYTITGHYIFPVPPGAAVTDFQATFGGQPQNITRQNGEDSNILLYKLVAERHDPSLLQYADWETLSFTIELPAWSSRKMTLAYQEMLPPSGGLWHYQYILSTERYSARPLEHASMTVNIESSRGIASVYSSSHDISTEYVAAGRARVTWVARDIQPVDDFHLFITPTEGDFGSGFMTDHQNGEDHFLFIFAPERVEYQANAIAKDIVFVIDRSGSMAGEKIDQAQSALHYILDQLNENDRFSIVGFDDVINTLAGHLLPVNRQNLTSAHSFVSGLYDRNGTDIEGALQVGLQILRQSEVRAGTSKMIVFLTDGLPTEGVTEPQDIVDLVSNTNLPIEARMHVFGVGYDVNTHLLDQLASKNGGSVTYVQPGENLESALSHFYERIAYPILTDLTIEFDGITVNNLYPQQLPDLFAGSTLMLTGQFRSDNGQDVTIAVNGGMNGTRYTYTYKVDLSEIKNASFVPGLWATRHIGYLLDIIRVEGETATLVEQVQELGMNYGIVTPYTTFIITAQSAGAASAENMALYGNTSELNRASGAITIQARVQNQSYQQATQVNLARGANVLSYNGQNMIQMDDQTIDLNLLGKFGSMEHALSTEWVATNIKADRQVAFGTDAYFKLAGDPVARAFLQNGNNVIFVYDGEIIEITDTDNPQSDPAGSETQYPTAAQPFDRGLADTPLKHVKIRVSQFFRILLRYLFE